MEHLDQFNAKSRTDIPLKLNEGSLIVTVQYGRLETVRWLVENTRDKERLASREGERERCLLHTAARYGQVRYWQQVVRGEI